MDKHIIYLALASLVLAICAVRFGPLISAVGFMLNVQLYRYFDRQGRPSDKDMKALVVVAGVGYILTAFMPYVIALGLLEGIGQIIYGIATLSVILSTVYICIYLYGERK